MSYYGIISEKKDFDFNEALYGISLQDVFKAIKSGSGSERSLFAFLSVSAESMLEEMAHKAHQLTLQYFGKIVQLYTPLYLSDYCENECVYCGFNLKNEFARSKLSLLELEREAEHIVSTGIRHVLILTGDSRRHSPLEYIRSCARLLKKYFSSISVEIYALTKNEYAQLVADGVDGLTIYQETYLEDVYNLMHRAGPKRDYLFRLEAPERALEVGMRTVNIGVLLGLADWRKDAYLLGLHAKYLMDNFPSAEVSISLPRLKAHRGDFSVPFPVSDRQFVQMITAFRIFEPRLGITLSTREPAQLRDNLIPLGITRISAGSSTRVGGHTLRADRVEQFSIADDRNVSDVARMLVERGYQPVYKDWVKYM